jgi:choice-of-anchor A domain-containing protein
MDQSGRLNIVKSNETVAVLAQSGDKSNNQMTVSLKEELNATADLETAPYAYSDCDTLNGDLSWWSSRACGGRRQPTCVSKDYMVNLLQTYWADYCASPSSTPSTSPDASFNVYICECIEYNTYKPNIISLNSMDASADAEGIVFAGGNANFQAGFSIGVKAGFTGQHATAGGNMLVVGGDLSYPTGHVDGGDIVVGGSASVGSSVLNAGTSVTVNPTFVDFHDVEEHFVGLNTRTCGLADTGYFQSDKSSLTAVRGNAQTEVFTLTSDDIPGVKSLDFSGISGSASVIVNFKAGSDVNFGFKQIVPNGRHVLFNFCGTNTITIANIQVDGSIMAPTAAINGQGGVVEGQVVARSYSGSTQFNDLTCGVCL